MGSIDFANSLEAIANLENVSPQIETPFKFGKQAESEVRSKAGDNSAVATLFPNPHLQPSVALKLASHGLFLTPLRRLLTQFQYRAFLIGQPVSGLAHRFKHDILGWKTHFVAPFQIPDGGA